ncbi:hypothetical protein ACQEVF_01525 [Nonomuraea polychroma]
MVVAVRLGHHRQPGWMRRTAVGGEEIALLRALLVRVSGRLGQ